MPSRRAHAGTDGDLLLMSFVPFAGGVSTHAGEVSLQLAATNNQKWAGNERPR